MLRTVEWGNVRPQALSSILKSNTEEKDLETRLQEGFMHKARNQATNSLNKMQNHQVWCVAYSQDRLFVHNSNPIHTFIEGAIPGQMGREARFYFRSPYELLQEGNMLKITNE